MSAEASGCGSLTTAGAVVGYWKMSATYYRACLCPVMVSMMWLLGEPQRSGPDRGEPQRGGPQRSEPQRSQPHRGEPQRGVQPGVHTKGEVIQMNPDESPAAH
jgi:hypothetical protein